MAQNNNENYNNNNKTQRIGPERREEAVRFLLEELWVYFPQDFASLVCHRELIIDWRSCCRTPGGRRTSSRTLDFFPRVLAEGPISRHPANALTNQASVASLHAFDFALRQHRHSNRNGIEHPRPDHNHPSHKEIMIWRGWDCGTVEAVKKGT